MCVCVRNRERDRGRDGAWEREGMLICNCFLKLKLDSLTKLACTHRFFENWSKSAKNRCHSHLCRHGRPSVLLCSSFLMRHVLCHDPTARKVSKKEQTPGGHQKAAWRPVKMLLWLPRCVFYCSQTRWWRNILRAPPELFLIIYCLGVDSASQHHTGYELGISFAPEVCCVYITAELRQRW